MTHPFLIIGGYGTVGCHLVSLLNEFLPELPIVIAGRNAQKATDVASRFRNTTGIAIDTRRADLGLNPQVQFSGIALLTNDLSNYPAEFAIKQSIPYTSIATQLNHIAPKLALYLDNPSACRVLIQDTSFAGALISAGIYCTNKFRSVEQIKVGVLMDENDLGGPASMADFDDFAQKEAGLVLVNSQWKVPHGNEAQHKYTLQDGSIFIASSLPGFDAAELAQITKAHSVRVDLIVGQSPASREGNKPSVEVLYEIDGILANGVRDNIRIQLTHPEGQSFMTAVGVAVGIESMLLNPKNTGIYLTSQKISPDLMIERLIQTGAILQKINI